MCSEQCAADILGFTVSVQCAVFAVWDAAAGKCGEGETGARYKVHTSLSPPPLPLLNTNPLSICLLFIWDSSELLPLTD